MKTKEELNALKNEVDVLNNKLSELNEEELAEVIGGLIPPYPFINRPSDDTFEGTFDGNPKAVKIDVGFESEPQP